MPLFLCATSCRLGLWAMSGMACGGLCGPRFRWEEDRNEKFMHTDAAEEEADAIPWGWRECTRLRIQDAHDFCMTTRPSHPPKPKRVEEEEPFEGLDRVLAAVGFPQQPAPARRGMLSQDLFTLPPPPPLQGIGDILPPADLNRPPTARSRLSRTCPTLSTSIQRRLAAQLVHQFPSRLLHQRLILALQLTLVPALQMSLI